MRVSARLAPILAILLLAAACSPVRLAELKPTPLDAGRLTVGDRDLLLEGAAICQLVDYYEPNQVPSYGASLDLRNGGTLYWLRYATKDDIPPPYTPYSCAVVLKGKGEARALDVHEGFILETVFDARDVVWLAGHLNSGRINYWEVLYLFDLRNGTLTWINETANRNSVVVDSACSAYVDVTVRHRTEEPPFGEDSTIDPAPRKYRIYRDGRAERQGD